MTTHNINQNDIMEYEKLKKAYTTHKKYFNIVKKIKKVEDRQKLSTEYRKKKK